MARKAKLSCAFIYPEDYSLGMSNLGFQVVYDLLDSHPDVKVERFFFSRECKPKSLETHRSLKEFDLIALSLSFEPDFFKFIEMLKASDIPLFSSERPAGSPMLIGGGIALSANPEPYAKFLDIIFLGEAEEVIYPFLETLLQFKRKRWEIREKFFEKVVSIPGFYVPSLNPRAKNVGMRIKKVEVKSLDKRPACSAIISGEASFKNVFLLELNRGCPWKCLFCLIGWTGGKTRFLKKEIAIKKIEEGLRFTPRLGLVGTALTSYNGVGEIVDSAMAKGARISFSSLRLNSGDSQFLETLKKSGQKMVTIAPEAGSERLRFLLGKEIKNSQIENTLRLSCEAGLSRIKLYFMYGLPWEREEDIDAVISLICSARKKFRRLKFIVSLSPFVPKPWTPLQWVPMEREDVLKDKLSYLKKGLFSIGGVRVTAESIRRALMEALLSRGDRGIIEHMLVVSHKELQGLREQYIYRERRESESFPWDFVDNGLDKKELYKLYENRFALA